MPHLALVLAQLCFGLFPLFGKWAMAALDPGAVAAWRIAFGALAIGAIAFARHGKGALPRGRDLLWLQVSALLGIALNQVLYLEGLERAPAVNAALIQVLIPVYVFAIAVLVRQERFSALRGLGIAVALAGAAWLIFQNAPDLSGEYFAGNLLFCLNALSFSIFLVISRPLTRRYPSAALTAWIYILCLWTIPLVPADSGYLPVEASSRVWLSLAFILLFPTVIAYLLNLYALSKVRASTAAVYTFLQPLVAAVTAAVFLQEALTWVTLWCTGLIFAGIWLVARGR